MNKSPLLLIIIFISCGGPQLKQSRGEALARKHCGSCHSFPDPRLLNKESWRQDVLPAMARKLNIDHIYEAQTDEQNIILSVSDWKKIVGYYVQNSPDSMPGQNRPVISQFTSKFKVRAASNKRAVPPSISFVGIDKKNKWILAADAVDSTLNIYNDSLKKISSYKVNGILVDALLGSDSGSSVFTLIGIMPPNDLRTGSVVSFQLNAQGSIDTVQEIISGLPRPVQTIPFRFTPSDEVRYLVCGFGNNTGGLYLVSPSDTSLSEVLNPSAGAIKAHTGDFNNDGIADIIALNAQSMESIDIYYGTKDRRFETVNLLRFPPIFGSTYFELADFNADGHPDILYSCGDNADYTGKRLKNYHGVYIYINDGRFNFKQRYFFPQHGAIKCIARDFDRDGDLDIASISFFPDLKSQPQESIIYLENKGNFSFSPYSVSGFDSGRWMTMDAGDIDGDGDDDIILGSMILPSSGSDSSRNLSNTSLLLLENTTHFNVRD